MLAARIVLTAVAAGVAIAVVGCEPGPPAVDRRARLLDMASGEATDIKSPYDRLVRQLNFAYRQQEDGHPAETRQSLARATETLRAIQPGDLNDQVRIAGWVSVSELSREADDRPAAERACGEAVDQLRKLPKVSDRPEYVVGVAAELKALYGNAPAAKLLVESAGWTKAIDNTDERRAAVRSVADAAFHCDDYAGGEQILRTDPDPAWRSDTLVALADEEPHGNLDWITNTGNAAVPGSMGGLVVTQNAVTNGATFTDANGNVVYRRERVQAGILTPATAQLATPAETPPTTVPTPYGKPVDFQSVFRRR